jgi:hypothetical protein
MDELIATIKNLYPEESVDGAINRELLYPKSLSIKFFETDPTQFVRFMLSRHNNILQIVNNISIKLFMTSMLNKSFYRRVESALEAPYDFRFNKYGVIGDYYPKLAKIVRLDVETILRSFALPQDFLKCHVFRKINEDDILMLFQVISGLLEITSSVEYKRKYIIYIHQLLISYYPKIISVALRIRVQGCLAIHEIESFELVLATL